MESSPFDSSPLNLSYSPRLFWQGRDSQSSLQSMNSENTRPYDPEPTYSSCKRPSIENLKRASRVKNSSIFAREHNNEYDPANVRPLERPLATNRGQGVLARMDSLTKRNEQNNHAGSSAGSPQPSTQSPSKPQASPAKSSLSKGTRFGGKQFDPQKEIWSDEAEQQRAPEEQSQVRNPKTVTFDNAPPQINEYEMTTPVPSSIASESREGSIDFDEDDEFDTSFDRGSFADHEDSFDASLEDIEKTPVVLPEDWRFMSRNSADDDESVHERDHSFAEDHRGPSDSDVRAGTETATRPSHGESLDSNGEKRPLPPLPSQAQSSRSHANKLSAALELASSAQRGLPSPPGPASYSKADITGSGRSSMSLEDRLRLMMMNDQTDPQTEADRQRERRMRRAGARERSQSHEPEDTSENNADTTITNDDLPTPPHISRDSILRNIQTAREMSYDDYDYSSQPASSPPMAALYDPDVPLPSLEERFGGEGVSIKEESDDEQDLYDIPEYNDIGMHRSSEHHSEQSDIDDESHYSRNSDEGYNDSGNVSGSELATPVPEIAPAKQTEASNDSDRGHEELTENVGNEKRDTNPVRPDDSEPSENGRLSSHDLEQAREWSERPITPNNDDGGNENEPTTPSSVIRHSVNEEPENEEPIPEPVATVKAPGTGLKTRPSLTPADAKTMAAVRRKVSAQEHPMPPFREPETVEPDEASSEDEATSNEPSQSAAPQLERQSSLVKLDIPLSSAEESLEFGLDKEFDRVIEAQKVAFELALTRTYHPPYLASTQDNRDAPASQQAAQAAANRFARQRGYLMRQNTKVIIASSNADDDTQSADSSSGCGSGGTSDNKSGPPTGQRKTSQPTWVAEPWNGKTRRQSMKMNGQAVKKKPVSGAVPPLPGMPSSVQDPRQGAEDLESPSLADQFEDGQERGRLFVKVVGVKDLDLPLPRGRKPGREIWIRSWADWYIGEKVHFSLTLDNGLHCVTTSWMELGRVAPIGQEFELLVQNELEFQLTLQMKVEGTPLRQVQQVATAPSPTKSKTSAFSRVFASPKKRKEMEMKQQLEQQKQKSDAKGASGPWDRLRTLIDRDGSFARAYVSLGDYEKHAFGRPYTALLPCFNEWAIEELSSVKSKKSTTSVTQKRPPYKIGNLELQLLYVPKPKGAKDEDMPKSMNACIREMREAEATLSRTWEGFLSQQGGDCPVSCIVF